MVVSQGRLNHSMTNPKTFHSVKLDTDLYEQIIGKGKYGETFSDILRRLIASGEEE